LLTIAYENASICTTVLTQQCMDSQAAGDTGSADPAACAAAIATCDAYFALVQDINVPPACRKKDGSGGNQAPCRFDSQCQAHFYCYATDSTHPTPLCQGTCLMGGTTCSFDHDCDLEANQRCVATFQAGSPPTSDANMVCQTVTYGAQGAACVANTNQQCQDGLGCDGNNKCQTLLATGASCDGANSTLCDTRKGDSCRADPNNPASQICTALAVVNVGAQCGTFGVPPTTQLCSSYAICTGTGTMTCAARVTMGQPCTASPNNCYPGLTCTGGTCQQGTPPMCPP
jgi:hypothetical protein